MGSNHCMNYGTESSIPRFRYMVIIISFSVLICCVLAGQVIDTNIAMNSKCCGLPRGSQEEGTSTNCMDYFETPHNKFQHSQNPKKLYIGGLFPLSGTSFSTNGNIDRQVACLALERINSMRFIPEYDLVMYYNDTQCHPGIGIDALYDQLYRRPTMMMLLGCSCSEVSKRAAMIVPYWNIVMLSYASTSVALSERDYYKTFFRTAAPDSSHNAARATFIRHFGWNTVATLMQDEELFSLAQSKLDEYFRTYTNISLVLTKDFVDDPTEQIDILKGKDVRIIIGSFQEKAARRVFCEQAYKKGMYGGQFVWFLLGWYQRGWWRVEEDTDCTAKELEVAVEGYFSVDIMDINMNNEKLISEQTVEEFIQEISNLDIHLESTHAPQTYDAVWTIALTLRTLIENSNKSLEDFKYEDPDWKDRIMRYLSKLHFNGVSGPVSFNGPDRYGITVFRQNQRGNMARVALYFPENGSLCFDCEGTNPILWEGNRIPIDKMQVIDQYILIHPSAFLIMTILASIGIAVAIVFLSFNVKYRKTKYIKLSSPNLNNILVVGCMLVYTAIIFCGFESHRVGLVFYTPLCTIRIGLLLVGFTLAFGSMFVKTYRVYHIITHATSRVIKRKMLHESTLFLMIGVLLVIDAVILLVWLIVDPMQRQENRLPRMSKNETTDFVPIIEVCASDNQNTWLVIIYIYKGLLLLFGVFLAWETRKVKIPALNDSNYIAVCVYNVVIMSVLAVFINNFVTQGDQVTVSYVLLALCILFMTTATLCLLFVPKLHAIRLSAGGDPVTRSVGLEIKGRTRRFVMDESTELKENISRAEIQVRLFKREKEKMDQKIAQLEQILRLLDKGGTPSVFACQNAYSSNHMIELEQLLELPETSIDNTSTDDKAVTEMESDNTYHVSDHDDISDRRSSTGSGDDIQLTTLEVVNSRDSEVYISSDGTATYTESGPSTAKEIGSQTSHLAFVHRENDFDEDTFREFAFDRRESLSSLLDQATAADSDFESHKDFGGARSSTDEQSVDNCHGTPPEQELNEYGTSDTGFARKESEEVDEEVKDLIEEMQEVQRRLLQVNGNTRMIYYV
ncbi:Gamma-aminobutyric acid type B receptor subunit 2 [Holothuria leucospilota]|uniref:Gamma-aminobutyric acid type B receptor subunit 2 n=1 Tax=Holothuria leucospilota TaxID=206669 RepID=A0A9Q1BJR0_HOLLE|nr:Gamma-aminobutyric acid type B receptor subunit 2 [Holothuria leucospilota]